MQLLAIQAADEARHIEVFTRRARLRRDVLGLSTAGGQASLATLFDEPDFAIASFLLSVLGEGSFLSLLWFIRDHAPDACTRQVAKLAAQDEARHVAFGLAHLARSSRRIPPTRALAAAIERRHTALAHKRRASTPRCSTPDPARRGGWEPAGSAARSPPRRRPRSHDGHAAASGSRGSLRRRGAQAQLSSLHTRNFMYRLRPWRAAICRASSRSRVRLRRASTSRSPPRPSKTRSRDRSIRSALDRPPASSAPAAARSHPRTPRSRRADLPPARGEPHRRRAAIDHARSARSIAASTPPSNAGPLERGADDERPDLIDPVRARGLVPVAARPVTNRPP